MGQHARYSWLVIGFISKITNVKLFFVVVVVGVVFVLYVLFCLFVFVFFLFFLLADK